MGYKLDFSELDRTVQEAIQWLLQDNLDCLEVFEGLEIDNNYNEEEDYI